MAFLKFTRDKRGVENFFIVQPTTNRRGKVRPRVLYWFRSPPDVKVGRQPFEASTRRALETQNPDVKFDWRAIVETPIPSADADKWRERRRAEKAAKHAAAAEAAAQTADAETENGETADGETANGDSEPDADDAAGGHTVIEAAAAAAPVLGSHPAPSDAPRDPARESGRRRRRRRRGGGGRPSNGPSGN